jgi:hypothetical protein
MAERPTQGGQLVSESYIPNTAEQSVLTAVALYVRLLCALHITLSNLK